MNDKRKDQRISKKLVVSYGDNGFEKLGMTLNISSKGMCIMSQSTLPTNRTVMLNLAIFDEVYEIMGLVKWSKQGMSKDADDVQVGLGIKILDAPKGYLNCVKYLVKNMSPRDH